MPHQLHTVSRHLHTMSRHLHTMSRHLHTMSRHLHTMSRHLHTMSRHLLPSEYVSYSPCVALLTQPPASWYHSSQLLQPLHCSWHCNCAAPVTTLALRSPGTCDTLLQAGKPFLSPHTYVASTVNTCASDASSAPPHHHMPLRRTVARTRRQGAVLAPSSPSNTTIRNSHRDGDDTVCGADHSTDAGALTTKWVAALSVAGVPEPEESVRLITAHVLGAPHRDGGRPLSPDQLQLLENLLTCRMQRMPVQYVVGGWDFHNITLELWPPVFIPRPETEQLVELTLRQLEALTQDKTDALRGAADDGAPSCRRHLHTGADHPVAPSAAARCPKVLDLCCGSGAVGLALLHAHQQVEVVGVDQSGAALACAAHNALSLRLNERLTLVHAALRPPSDSLLPLPYPHYDIVVANPPYVPTGELRTLAPEVVLYEDLRALDGGSDGLAVLRSVAWCAGAALHEGGHLFVEVHSSHGELLPEWLQGRRLEGCREVDRGLRPPLRVVRVIKDYRGHDRFVHLVKVAASGSTDTTPL